ncbi:MAG TPA: thioesterase family protein [Euzebyales bacterium]|nr:thioesterase family protein [Euzebyales bacterium]
MTATSSLPGPDDLTGWMRSDFPVLRPQQTRWHDDDTYGHVNNVVYYAYFDTAVNGYLIEAAGTDIRGLPAIGIVAETACRYLRQIGFPDRLDVGLAVSRLGRSSVSYQLAVLRADEESPSAVGRFVHVYIDRATGRPVPIPDVLGRVLEPLVVSP